MSFETESRGRMEGIAPPNALQRHGVFFIGAGSAASQPINQCARHGLKWMTVADFDKVVARNGIGTLFVKSHIGLPKVEAMGLLVDAIDDSINYVGWNHKVTIEDIPLIQQMARRHSLLALLADDPEVMMAISDACYPICPIVRAVFGERCNYAEIAYSIPNETPPIRSAMRRRQGERRIERPSALGCDTDRVGCMITEVIFGILLGEHLGRDFFPFFRRAPLMLYFLRRTMMFAQQPPDLISGCLAIEVPWTPNP